MNRADRRKLEKTLIKSGKSKEEAKLLANSQKNPVMRIKKMTER